MWDAEDNFATDPSLESYASLTQAERFLSIHYTESTTSDAKLLKARLFESGDKNLGLLANLVADPKFQMVVR